MVTDQQQRHQYLEALGISSWLPRAPLPGAAPSADWVWDFSLAAPDIPFPTSLKSTQPQAKPSQTVNDPASARAALSRSFGDLGAEKKAPNNSRAALKKAVVKQVTPEPAAAASAPDEVPAESPRKDTRPQPRFNLAFLQCGDLLVVDSLPTRTQSGFSNQHRTLIESVVLALTGRLSQAGEHTLLPWPTFASTTLTQGYGEAVGSVQHKLNGLLTRSEVRGVLLLGESAARMCLDREEGVDALRGIEFTLRGGVKARVSYSLNEALQLPGIKKLLWQDLQPLYATLADG